MEYSHLIRKRRSVRSFRQGNIDEGMLKKIMDDINQAPSAGNLQSYRVYLVRGRELKKKLAAAAYGQDFLEQASLLMVFCADRKRSASKYGKRGETLYSIQDATIAATYAILSAENSGLSSVWVGAFDESLVSEILGLEEDLMPVAIIPIGYPGENPEFPGRRRIEDIFLQVD